MNGLFNLSGMTPFDPSQASAMAPQMLGAQQMGMPNQFQMSQQNPQMQQNMMRNMLAQQMMGGQMGQMGQPTSGARAVGGNR